MAHFLFLQGLPGPSMRLIARQLKQQGAQVSRLNFNGGDWLNWNFGGGSFRGRKNGFDQFLRNYCAQQNIDAIVMFGDTRPLNNCAKHVAKDMQIDTYVLEEGYLRPFSATLEFWPAGVRWQAPKTLEECDARAARLPADFDVTDISALRKNRVNDAIKYWACATIFRPFYLHHQTHRLFTPAAELLLWLRRFSRHGQEKRASRGAMDKLGSQPFFLFPLQLDGDASIKNRSPYADMADAARAVICDFAANSPADAHLVVKRHPYDPAATNWRRLIEHFAAQLGIEDRLHFIEHGNLDWLLDNCLGVVTVNSTVGQLAVARGRPTLALGEALYSIPGMTHDGSLARFWHGAEPPRPDAYERFSRALWSECLVNGGFHSRQGLELLARRAADKMLESTV